MRLCLYKSPRVLQSTMNLLISLSLLNVTPLTNQAEL